jgi:solute carrier family 25 (peroxisomal adenine nucleotide transporter), member 17
MAKTRLQAKYEDDSTDEEAAIGSEKAKLLPKQKRKERYSGALDVLRQEYKQNGFAGWYQVSLQLACDRPRRRS